MVYKSGYGSELPHQKNLITSHIHDRIHILVAVLVTLHDSI